MRFLWFYIKFILKGGYCNKFKRLKFSQGSWIGKNVSIFFEKPFGKNQFIFLGRDVKIGHFSDMAVGKNDSIIIKDFTTLNTHCKIAGDVTIERYCLLSSNIFLSSGTHHTMVYPYLLIRHQDQRVLSTKIGAEKHSKPVHIEEDVWIGFGVYVKQGITIGRGAIIGANSVVLKDVAPYEIVGGSPARHLKSRLDFQPKNLIEAKNEEDRPYFYQGFDHYNISDKNPSKEIGLLAYEECKVAIPFYYSQWIVCKGFLMNPDPLSMKVFIDDVLIKNFQIVENCFELKIQAEHGIANEKKFYNCSFITFAIQYNKTHHFGINSIQIIDSP